MTTSFEKHFPTLCDLFGDMNKIEESLSQRLSCKGVKKLRISQYEIECIHCKNTYRVWIDDSVEDMLKCSCPKCGLLNFAD